MESNARDARPRSWRVSLGGLKRARTADVLNGRTELAMVYQPIVSTMTGEPIGAEALARFVSEPYRTPDRWFADARDVGLGIPLELLAARKALEGLPGLRGGELSINLSAATLASSELAAMVRDCGGAARTLVLEITEHDSVAHYRVLRDALDGLRALGVRIAVDDAGAGYASFTHVLELRPDVIKLDRAVCDGVHLDPVRRALVSAMADFAADIGASVVAEGIESPEDFRILRASGVPYAQGYLCGRPGPLPLERVPDLLSRMATAIVVDDDPVVRTMITKIARRAGLEVAGAAVDGRHALALARDVMPDVILLDIEMPALTGLEILPVLRRELPSTRIVVLSAHDSRHDHERLSELGADAVIGKSHFLTVLPQELRRIAADAESRPRSAAPGGAPR